MKQLFFLFAIIFGFTVITKTAYAGQSCQPTYGGGEVCVQAGNILINKKVSSPQNDSFVENLGINDLKYLPEKNVTFELIITNTGGSTLPKAVVKDIFPKFVEFASGPGVYDSNSRILSFELQDLKANESRSIKITGKIAALNQLPADQNVVCVVNQANAAIPNTDQQSQDNAQFCIQKVVTEQPVTKGGLKVFPPAEAKKTPPTGPEVFALIGLIPTGVLGYFLRKKSTFNKN